MSPYCEKNVPEKCLVSKIFVSNGRMEKVSYNVTTVCIKGLRLYNQEYRYDNFLACLVGWLNSSY